MDAQLYNVYLYDPAGTQTEVSSLIRSVSSLEELGAALAGDTNGVGIDASSGKPNVRFYAATEKADRHRTDYALSLLSPDGDYTAKTVGSNSPEMKQRKEITCELLFIEIVAVGFLGIASVQFKEKQMGVIRVHAIMPLHKSLFVFSKITLFLLTDLIFAALMVLFNIGLKGVSVLPAVLVQTAILSLIMALAGFGCTMLLRDFKQFSLGYLVIALFAAMPVFLAANTSVKMSWIDYHPFYHVYMGLKNAFFGGGGFDYKPSLLCRCDRCNHFTFCPCRSCVLQGNGKGGLTMKGLIYQLKSVRKDKFCIMAFLLPIVVAAALNFIGSIDLSSLGEFHFGVTAQTANSEVSAWLEQYGTVTVYPTQEELVAAINEPSTNLIGVEMDGSSIQTILSGDELDVFRQTANTLPTLYEQWELLTQASVQVLERPDMMAGYQNIFIAITLIVAMFMGCTFNAMNIISEKEDGIALINEILPMTNRQYMIQKIFVGFVFGFLSAFFTAAICFRLSFSGIVAMLALIILSAFVSALIGLLVGKLSDGMMVGVVYIKIVMIVFMAVPILNFLLGTGNKIFSYICYFIPSSATFEGIIDLVNGSTVIVTNDIAILTVHCVFWFLLYLFISNKQGKQA